jgi:hypothetical protein
VGARGLIFEEGRHSLFNPDIVPGLDRDQISEPLVRELVRREREVSRERRLAARGLALKAYPRVLHAAREAR